MMSTLQGASVFPLKRDVPEIDDAVLNARADDRDRLPQIERRQLPDIEDLRMVRAIAALALIEAAKRGAYRATFRRFVVNASRERSTDSAAHVMIRVNIAYDGRACEASEVADVWGVQDDTCV